MKFKTRYSVPSNLAYHTKIEGPSLTSQKYADRVDLNRIIGFESGQLIIKDQATFLDTFDEKALYNNIEGNFVDTVGLTYIDLSNNLANLKNEFESLPADVRRHYKDDVNVFLDSIVEYQKQQKANVASSPVISEEPQKAGSEVSEVKSE